MMHCKLSLTLSKFNNDPNSMLDFFLINYPSITTVYQSLMLYQLQADHASLTDGNISLITITKTL
jgi:hypothetical protein